MYKFTAKELDNETSYTYFGARYYDSELSGWLSVDPMSDKYPSLSPYCYSADNPVVLKDPNGMLITDYYDIKTGEHLEHIDDGIDEAIAINSIVYNALKSDGNLTNQNAKDLGGISLGGNTDFEMIAATLYAEASIKNSAEECAAIYDVIENRSNVSGKSINEIIKSTGIYGYGSKNYNIALSEGKGYNANEYSTSRHNAARKGAMMGILNPNNKLDYSQGAYYWQGSDFANHTKGSHAYERFYKVGFKFTNTNHDIWNLGDIKSGNTNWDYKYQSTGAVGKTTFMKLTNEWIKANNYRGDW